MRPRTGPFRYRGKLPWAVPEKACTVVDINVRTQTGVGAVEPQGLMTRNSQIKGRKTKRIKLASHPPTLRLHGSYIILWYSGGLQMHVGGADGTSRCVTSDRNSRAHSLALFVLWFRNHVVVGTSLVGAGRITEREGCGEISCWDHGCHVLGTCYAQTRLAPECA